MSYDVLKSENVYNGRVFHIEKDEITLPTAELVPEKLLSMVVQLL